MSIDAITRTSPAPQPTPHPAWCQHEHCSAFPGDESTHRHLIGEVADQQVWVERDDHARGDGTQQVGKPKVHVLGEQATGMDEDTVEQYIGLLRMAARFAVDAREVR